MRKPTLDLFASKLCHQFLWYIAQVLRKILKEKLDHLIIVTPTWQTQPWYVKLLQMSVQPLFFLSQIRNLVTNPLGKKKISGVEGFQVSLQMEGISSNAAKVVSHSKKKSSTTNYKSAWDQWTSWYNDREVNSFQTPVNYINFLSEKYVKGLQYKTINSLRSPSLLDSE